MFARITLKIRNLYLWALGIVDCLLSMREGLDLIPTHELQVGLPVSVIPVDRRIVNSRSIQPELHENLFLPGVFDSGFQIQTVRPQVLSS